MGSSMSIPGRRSFRLMFSCLPNYRKPAFCPGPHSEMKQPVFLIHSLAIVCGVYMLRGSNWARWLALAWLAFHVIVSSFHAWHQLLVHGLLLAVVAYLLFRPQTTQYFRFGRAETN